MKILPHFFVFGLLFSSVLATQLHAAENELVLLNWHDYLAPKVIQAFEEKYQARLKLVYFTSGQERDQRLRKLEDFDLTVISGNEIPTYLSLGWLHAINPQRIPNLQHLMRRWLWQPDSPQLYGIPYTWGNIGIAYRQDKLAKPPQTWRELLHPNPELYKRVRMNGDIFELMGVALKSLGYSANTTELTALKQAEELLLQQKLIVNNYSTPKLDKNNDIVNGTIWLSMAFNGDAPKLAQLDNNIQFITPKEGCLLFTDYWVVLSRSKHKQLAADFLNFLQEPHIAAETALTLHYATPNKAAFALLPAEHRNDHNIYPPADIIARSEFLNVNDPDVIRGYIRTLSLLAK